MNRFGIPVVDSYARSVTLDRVVDGDTIYFIVDLGFSIRLKVNVRLAGIDTPEARTLNLIEKKHGIQATEFVKTALDQKVIMIRTYKTGKYGRYIADVYYRSVDEEEWFSLVEQLKMNGFDKRESYDSEPDDTTAQQ